MTDPGRWRTLLDPARCAAPDCRGLAYPDRVLYFKSTGAVMCKVHGEAFLAEAKEDDPPLPPEPKENRASRRRKAVDKVVPV